MRYQTLRNNRGHTLRVYEVRYTPYMVSKPWGVVTVIDGIENTEWFRTKEDMQNEYETVIQEWERGEIL